MERIALQSKNDRSIVFVSLSMIAAFVPASLVLGLLYPDAPAWSAVRLLSSIGSYSLGAGVAWLLLGGRRRLRRIGAAVTICADRIEFDRLGKLGWSVDLEDVHAVKPVIQTGLLPTETLYLVDRAGRPYPLPLSRAQVEQEPHLERIKDLLVNRFAADLTAIDAEVRNVSPPWLLGVTLTAALLLVAGAISMSVAGLEFAYIASATLVAMTCLGLAFRMWLSLAQQEEEREGRSKGVARP